MIKKKSNRYVVQVECGKSIGTYLTRKEAENRLKQIELSKRTA